MTTNNPRPIPELTGDYFWPFIGTIGDKPCVWFLKSMPVIWYLAAGAYRQHVVSPPHVLTEEPDGTLTITASVGDKAKDSESEGWHGFLTEGEWRKC